MESVTAKKKFCSPKCKVYYNRELGAKVLAETKKSVQKAEKIETKVKEVATSVTETKKELTAFELYQRKKLGLK